MGNLTAEAPITLPVGSGNPAQLALSPANTGDATNLDGKTVPAIALLTAAQAAAVAHRTVLSGLPTPALNAPSTSNSGGTLLYNLTYYYRLTAYVNGPSNETLPSPEVSVLASASGVTTNTYSNTLTWSAVSGAQGYKVYRSTAAGQEVLLATLGAVTTFTDTTMGSPLGATPPLVNNTFPIDVIPPVLPSSATPSQLQAATGTNNAGSLPNGLIFPLPWQPHTEIDVAFSCNDDGLLTLVPMYYDSAGMTVGPSVSAPTSVAGAPSTTGGVMAAGAYLYRVTSLTPYGESTASTAMGSAVTTTGATGSVNVTWTAAANASGYNVYRTAAGGSEGTEQLIATVSGQATAAYLDTGVVTPSGALPTSNTTNKPQFFAGDPFDVVLPTGLGGSATTHRLDVPNRGGPIFMRVSRCLGSGAQVGINQVLST